MIRESQPKESYSVICQSLPSASETNLSEILKKSNSHMYLSTREVLGLASCHNKNRYVTVISRDIRMYCGRFVGPSHTIHGWSPCFCPQNSVGRKNDAKWLQKRTSTVWFSKTVCEGSNPRVSRGLHTHIMSLKMN